MDVEFWRKQRVLLTGGNGFLGRHVVAALDNLRPGLLYCPRSADYDLRKVDDIRRVLRMCNPTMVIHLAAKVGGILANKRAPAEFFYDNLIMGTQLLHESRGAGVNKFVTVGTVCSYPKNAPVPFLEENLWEGHPEETNAPYGIAKRALLTQCQAYRQQYGFNSVYLIPVNLYGPGDLFDLETSHVIPALVRKCIEAKEAGTDFVVWGTGKASREFLYVDDAARGIVMAAELYNKPEPVNLGSGQETPISGLVDVIVKLIGFTGKIVWDTSMPDGQPRRCLYTGAAKREFGFEAKVPLVGGICKTIDWYMEHRRELV